jgi:solute:Na+ symporter, SSS family
MRIHPIDLGIVVAYLIGVTALGMRFRRRQQDNAESDDKAGQSKSKLQTLSFQRDREAVSRDYFLGGRTAPWWALAFSIVATETSTLTIIGTPAISYGGNLTFLQLVFGYLIGRVVIVLLLLPGYFRGEFFTAYALIEKRFGEKMRAVAASTFLITRAIAEGVRVSAIALVVSVVLGTSEHLAVVVVIALTVLYTFEGGMNAVIWTDVAQLLVYLAGSAVTFFVLLHRIPGGWREVLYVGAASEKLYVLDFSFAWATKYTFWSGLIGGTFITMASHGTDQTIVQRILAARDERDSRKALLTSGAIVLVQFTVFLMIGVFLFVFAQHWPLLKPGERVDRILPLFLVREMPVGLAGLLLASILAVAMSNASGSLNSLAASSVLDFARLRGRGAMDAAGLLRISRRATLGWGLVLMAFGFVKWGPLLETGLTVASLPFGSLLGLFLLGTLDRRADSRGALVGMFAGLAAILSVYRFTNVAYTWYLMIGTGVTFAIGAIASRVAGNPRGAIGPGEVMVDGD